MAKAAAVIVILLCIELVANFVMSTDAKTRFVDEAQTVEQH